MSGNPSENPIPGYFWVVECGVARQVDLIGSIGRLSDGRPLDESVFSYGPIENTSKPVTKKDLIMAMERAKEALREAAEKGWIPVRDPYESQVIEWLRSGKDEVERESQR